MRNSAGLLTRAGNGNGEALCLLTSQGDGVAEQAKLDRISAERVAGKLYFDAFHQSEDHQALYVRMFGINVVDDVFPALFKRC